MCSGQGGICRAGGGSRGTSPSLDLTFPPTGLSENLGGMERGGEGKGRVGETTCLTSPPPGFCLDKYHPGSGVQAHGAPALPFINPPASLWVRVR